MRAAVVAMVCLAGPWALWAQVPRGAPATSPAPDRNKVVITVGEQTMTAGEFADFVADLPPEYQAMAAGPGKRRLADEIVKFKVLAAEAQKRGLDSDPKMQRQLAMIREQLLAQSLLSAEQARVVDADLEKYYADHKEEFEQVKARHILVRTDGPGGEAAAKKKADDIRRTLTDANFAEMARKDSDDKGSAIAGGNLGMFQRGQMVPEFERAAFALKTGEISQPVRSDFGYHIIQVQERSSVAYEQAKPMIRARLLPQRIDALVEQLKKTMNTTLDEAFFGAAPAPAPVPAAGDK